jgi:hemerythrin-like metal-binding protein
VEENEKIKALETGVQIINNQHKKIAALTTELYTHVTGDDEAENQYFGETIQGTVDFFTSHFKAQEELMAVMDFPPGDCAQHKQEHGEFVSSIGEHITRFQQTKCADLLTVASYVKWWVLGHTKKQDKKYAEYFNKLVEGKGIEAMRV